MAGEGGVACPVTGDILVADPEAFAANEGGIIEVNASNGVRTTVSANNSPSGGPSFLNPYNLARERGPVTKDECEDLFVADAGVFGAADGRVIRVDPLTGIRTLVSETGVRGGGPDLEDPVGIAVEASGEIVVADADAFGSPGGLIRVDPDTGDRTVLSQNLGVAPLFFEPYDVVTESNGDLLVVDSDGLVAFGSGSVMRVDPTTGGRTTVSDLNTPPGPPDFNEPQGLNLGADVLVADADAYAGSGGGILDVDATTGTRTTVSENNSPTGGPSFVDPSDVAAARFSGGTKYVTDASAYGGTGGVLSLNSSGNRTTLSRNASPVGPPTFVEPWGIVVVGLRLVAVTVKPITFPVLGQAPRSSASGKSGGTTIRYKLFERARMKFTVHRRLRGRAGRFRCKRETSNNRTRKACRRYKHVGTFERGSRRGSNSVRWSGRIRGRALSPGRYRITLVAINRRGNRSDSVSREFTIVRR